MALRDVYSGLLSFPYFAGPVEATPAELGEAKILADHLLQTGELPLVSSPSPADASFPGETGGWLGVALRTDGRPFGVIAVQSDDPAIPFTDDDREILGFVSPAIAIALERKQAEARIQYLAYYDAVTGLPNRNLLLDRLQLAVAQATRDRNHMAVLVLNLDRLKVINESLGHTVGDHVVKAHPQGRHPGPHGGRRVHGGGARRP